MHCPTAALPNTAQLQMNHSRSANVGRYFERGAQRVSYFTLRALQRWEELVYDYGPHYWRGREANEL